jgi:hypothetical protein
MEGFTRLLLDRHPSLADFVDPEEADADAALLTVAGLGALNGVVLHAPTLAAVVDAITEHTVGTMLVRQGFRGLQYEPPELAKPVDFVGVRDGRRYWLEVKRLGSSAHDTLHARVMDTLNRALEAETAPVSLRVELAETFTAPQTNLLIRHVKATLRRGVATGTYTFPSGAEAWSARYELHRAPTRAHPHVTVLSDDLDELRDITGVDQDRVRHKIQDGYAKLRRELDGFAAIVLHVDRTVPDRTIGEALYGREHFTFSRRSKAVTLGRSPNGLFSHRRYSRLTAVVIARRPAYRLFVPYNLVIFPHPAAPVASIHELGTALGVAEVFLPNQ